MARYRYTGPGPIEILSGGDLLRPGDEREFDAEPTWGPWELIDAPEEEPGTGQQSGTGPAPAQAAADGGQPIVAPISLVTPKGM